jgi:hypothetical protein
VAVPGAVEVGCVVVVGLEVPQAGNKTSDSTNSRQTPVTRMDNLLFLIHSPLFTIYLNFSPERSLIKNLYYYRIRSYNRISNQLQSITKFRFLLEKWISKGGNKVDKRPYE